MIILVMIEITIVLQLLIDFENIMHLLFIAFIEPFNSIFPWTLNIKKVINYNICTFQFWKHHAFIEPEKSFQQHISLNLKKKKNMLIK